MLAMRVYLIALLAGCGLYWNNPPPDAEICAGNGGVGGEQLRDPNTGQCTEYTGDYCGCLPCAEDPPDPVPSWSQCAGPCEQLDETTCLATSSCHAAYTTSDTDLIRSPAFWGCWEVEPTGPLEGSCTGLDAYTCTAHDDCIGVYSPTQDPSDPYQFSQCAPEPNAQPACSTLATEAACTARPDCDPVYVGSNCTCDEHGCTCQTETFDYCE
jgi:hypothetical protein